MGLVYIDFLPSGEVAHSMWFNWATMRYECHVPSTRKLPFVTKKDELK